MRKINASTPPEEILARTALCADMTEAELHDLGAIASLRVLAPGELLCSEGEFGDRAYVIGTGLIDVVVGQGRHALTIATLQPFDVFGELSLIEPGPRTASGRAARATIVLELPFDELQKMREALNSSAFKLTRELSKTVCRRIRSINKQIEQESGDLISADTLRTPMGGTSAVPDDASGSGNGVRGLVSFFRRLIDPIAEDSV